MNVEDYLQRLGYNGDRIPNAETLRNLHHAHLLAVPFENLDIHLGRPIVLDEKSLYEKIVRRRRGGFCYEANGLFAALLRELGFNVALLSARVMDGGKLGPEFDHLTLLVQLEERWLADVGFGDSFLSRCGSMIRTSNCKLTALIA
jgi:N-hydroxyarylamine O-acetyltransferase